MIHKPIQLSNVSLSLPHKTCFYNFNTTIQYGSRIGIIGRNGSGKSTLLKILQRLLQVTGDVAYALIPQVIEEFNSLSGGQRFNKRLTEALSLKPNVLLLDEPTNNLDKSNRKSFMRMLKSFQGTVIIASHDVELLRECIGTFWHIVDGHVELFSGGYDDYMLKVRIARNSIEHELEHLDKQKKSMHKSLMAEQRRASKSRLKGLKSIEQRKWPTVTSNAKALRAEETSGRKKADISNKKQHLSQKLAGLRLPEIILPKFSLSSSDLERKVLVSINEGRVSYDSKTNVLRDINLSISTGDRVSIEGDNGCGKSTLIKAILNEVPLRMGHWYTIKRENIGYLDQHYRTLCPNKTVLETILELAPHWSHLDARKHLNDFLFRKNEEVNACNITLSGGEKARLVLACIGAKTPKLLILDEITNNLDLETREHVIQTLKVYRGAIVVVSHDEDFLREIMCNTIIQL